MYLPAAHIFHFNPRSNLTGGELFQITSPETLGETLAIMKEERRRKSLRQKRLAWSSHTYLCFYKSSGQLNIHPIFKPSLSTTTPSGHGLGCSSCDHRDSLRLTPGFIYWKATMEQMGMLMAFRYGGKGPGHPMTNILSLGRPEKGWQTLASIAKSLYACTAEYLLTFLAAAD